MRLALASNLALLCNETWCRKHIWVTSHPISSLSPPFYLSVYTNRSPTFSEARLVTSFHPFLTLRVREVDIACTGNTRRGTSIICRARSWISLWSKQRSRVLIRTALYMNYRLASTLRLACANIWRTRTRCDLFWTFLLDRLIFFFRKVICWLC